VGYQNLFIKLFEAQGNMFQGQLLHLDPPYNSAWASVDQRELSSQVVRLWQCEVAPLDSLDTFAYVTYVYGNDRYVARKGFFNDVWGPLVYRGEEYYIAGIKPNGNFLMRYA